MAQDNNEPPRVRGPPPGVTTVPEHVKTPQIYEIFPGPNPQDQAGAATEGQKSSSQPTITEGLRSIKRDDFFNVHQIPCARQGFMTGIGAGAAVGMGRYFVGARVPTAANWAFGAFFIGSIIQWEYCRAKRANEKAAMARAVEVMDRKQAEKKAQAAEAARLKREAEEKARQEAATKKSWYKFW
ncbi:cytochrome oxidase biogenesis protein, Cox20 subunit [Hypoxylon sp. NC0597]|nr:cytochrome oxidase biogenesis protein, Cox20 subunit [Hypoxylon sp. NC0597]